MRIRPEAGHHVFFLEDGAVLYSDPAQELHRLNAGAAYLWLALERGAMRDELSQEYSRRFSCEIEDARGHVEELLDAWTTRGWVGTGSNADIPHARDPVERPRRKSRTQPYTLPAGGAPDGALSCGILATQFLVVLPDDEASRRVAPALAHLACDSAEVFDVLVELEKSSESYSLHVDGDPIHSALSLEGIVPAIKAQLRSHAVDRNAYFMHIHAGAVAAGNACVLFPGPPGSGKTTLTAGLVTSGLGFLSDETVLLEPRTLAVRPVPLALTVKPGALAPLEPLYPGLRDLPVHLREDGERVRYLPPPRDSMVHDRISGYPVEVIVFPRFAPDAPGRLCPLSRLEALTRLLDCCLSLPSWLAADRVEALVRWMRRVPCFELHMNSVPEAVANLRGLLQSHGHLAANA